MSDYLEKRIQGGHGQIQYREEIARYSADLLDYASTLRGKYEAIDRWARWLESGMP